MKISKKRLKQIIKEELTLVSEEEMTIDTLEKEVVVILANLSPGDQAIINQYIGQLKSMGAKQ